MRSKNVEVISMSTKAPSSGCSKHSSSWLYIMLSLIISHVVKVGIEDPTIFCSNLLFE